MVHHLLLLLGNTTVQGIYIWDVAVMLCYTFEQTGLTNASSKMIKSHNRVSSEQIVSNIAGRS